MSKKVLLTQDAVEDLLVLPEIILAHMVSFMDYLKRPVWKQGKPQIGIPKRTAPVGPAKMGAYGLEYRVDKEKNATIVEKVGRYDAFDKVLYSARTGSLEWKVWSDLPFKAPRKLPPQLTQFLAAEPPTPLPKRLPNKHYPASEFGQALLARKLIARRHSVGLLQRELAIRAHIPAETLHRIERAKLTARPSTMKRIVAALEGAEEELRTQGVILGGAMERALLARQLTERRRALGITYEALAELSGLGTMTVFTLEKGKRIPNTQTAKRLRAVLKKLEGRQEQKPE